MNQVIESAVTSPAIRGRVQDARNKYADAWAELQANGTYNVIAVIGVEETGVRAELACESPVP